MDATSHQQEGMKALEGTMYFAVLTGPEFAAHCVHNLAVREAGDSKPRWELPLHDWDVGKKMWRG